jgi:hypothetical protein
MEFSGIVARKQRARAPIGPRRAPRGDRFVKEKVEITKATPPPSAEGRLTRSLRERRARAKREVRRLWSDPTNRRDVLVVVGLAALSLLTHMMLRALGV